MLKLKGLFLLGILILSLNFSLSNESNDENSQKELLMSSPSIKAQEKEHLEKKIVSIPTETKLYEDFSSDDDWIFSDPSTIKVDPTNKRLEWTTASKFDKALHPVDITFEIGDNITIETSYNSHSDSNTRQCVLFGFTDTITPPEYYNQIENVLAFRFTNYWGEASQSMRLMLDNQEFILDSNPSYSSGTPQNWKIQILVKDISYIETTVWRNGIKECTKQVNVNLIGRSFSYYGAWNQKVTEGLPIEGSYNGWGSLISVSREGYYEEQGNFFTKQVSNYFGGTPKDVVINDSLAYVITDKGDLSIINVTDPYNPSEITICHLNAILTCLYSESAFVYIGTYEGLLIVDIEDFGNPLLVGSYDSNQIVKIIELNDILYIITIENEVIILEVSDQGFPQELGMIDSSNGYTLKDIAVETIDDCTYMFLALGNSGLKIVNITNIEAIEEVKTYTTTAAINSVQINKTYAYIAGDNSIGIEILDVSDPSNPIKLNTYISATGMVHIDGRYVYTLGPGYLFQIIEIITPTTINLIGQFSYLDSNVPSEVFNGVGPSGFDVKENLVTLTLEGGALLVVNTTDKTVPSTATLFHHWGAMRNVLIGKGVNSGRAFIFLWTAELLIVDITNPMFPSIDSQFRRGSMYEVYDVSDMVLDNYILYIVYSDGLIIILDISDATDPKIIQTYSGEPVNDIQIDGKYVYLACSDKLIILNTSSLPATPTFVKEYTEWGGIRRILIDNNEAFVLNNSGLIKLSLEDLLSIEEQQTYFDLDFIYEFSIDHQYIYLAAELEGLVVIDKSSFQRIGEWTDPSSTVSMEKVGKRDNYIFVFDNYIERIVILDVTNPSEPMIAHEITSTWNMETIDVLDDYIYLGISLGQYSGLQMIRWSESTLKIGVQGYSDAVFDPLTSGFLYNCQRNSLMFDSLMEYNPITGELETALAELEGNVLPYTVSEDSKEWIFYLRDDVCFQDGTKFNASAVKFNFDRIIDPTLPAYREEITPDFIEIRNNLDSVEVKNEFEVAFHFTNSYAPFSNFEIPLMSIISPNSFDIDGNLIQPIGTGPYILDIMISGDEIQFFNRFDAYYQGTPPFELIFFDSEVEDIFTAVEEHRIDFIPRFTKLEFLDKFNGDNYWTYDIVDALSHELGIFNYQSEPLSDPLVRKAINLAFNRTKFIETFFGESATEMTNLFPPGMPFEDTTIEGYGFDTDIANELLDSAGYPRNNEGVRFELRLISHAPRQPRLIQFAEFLSAVGIESTIVADNSLVPSSGNTEWDIFLVGYLYGSDPNSLAIMIESDSEWNHGGFLNADIDQLLSLGISTPVKQEREVHYEQIQQIIQEEIPFLYIANRPLLYAKATHLNSMVFVNMKADISFMYSKPFQVQYLIKRSSNIQENSNSFMYKDIEIGKYPIYFPSTDTVLVPQTVDLYNVSVNMVYNLNELNSSTESEKGKYFEILVDTSQREYKVRCYYDIDELNGKNKDILGLSHYNNDTGTWDRLKVIRKDSTLRFLEVKVQGSILLRIDEDPSLLNTLFQQGLLAFVVTIVLISVALFIRKRR